MSVLFIVLVLERSFSFYQNKKLKRVLEASFSQLNIQEISGDALDKTKILSQSYHPKHHFYIDDMTANDLELDRFF